MVKKNRRKESRRKPRENFDRSVAKDIKRQMKRERKHIEYLLSGLRLAIYAELQLMRRDIIGSVVQAEQSIEVIARELGRQQHRER